MLGNLRQNLFNYKALESRLLADYKAIIRSIMPANYIAEDGFLKLPDGSSLETVIKIDRATDIGDIVCYAFGLDSQGAKMKGLFESIILYALRKNKSSFNHGEFHRLEKEIQNAKGPSYISLGALTLNNLSHEAFHTIQAVMAEYYPDVYESLRTATLERKEDILEIHRTSRIRRIYTSKSLFPQQPKDSYYWKKLGGIKREYPSLSDVIDQVAIHLGSNEAVPLLITATQKYSDVRAKNVLAAIFADVGFNKEFSVSMPSECVDKNL